MIVLCLQSSKCAWRTVELGDHELGQQLAITHGYIAHPDRYLWFVTHDSVPVLSPLALIELSFYTDFSEESIL